MDASRRGMLTILSPDTSHCCVLARLGASALTFDSVIGAASSLVTFRELSSVHGPRVEISPTTSGAVPHSMVQLALGHQHATAPVSDCPASASDGLQLPSEPRLAAVALVLDTKGRLLLTRRPRTMRTFPGCWVLPGGSVDPADQTLEKAALRELQEETGLSLAEVGTAAKPLCIWESCFPTTAVDWRERNAQGGRTSHHLIVYFLFHIGDGASVTLQPDECDCAVWIPVSDLVDSLRGGEQATGAYSFAPNSTSTSLATDSYVHAQSLAGVYPNAVGEGIGRGHLWAIRQLGRFLLV